MADSEVDYYEVLSVERDADAETIRRAYRKLAVQWHPDKNSAPEAADMFKRISEAYEVLSDPERRQRYDSYGRDSLREDYFNQGAYHFHDPQDLFRSVFPEFFAAHTGPSPFFSPFGMPFPAPFASPFAGSFASPFAGSFASPFAGPFGGPFAGFPHPPPFQHARSPAFSAFNSPFAADPFGDPFFTSPIGSSSLFNEQGRLPFSASSSFSSSHSSGVHTGTSRSVSSRTVYQNGQRITHITTTVVDSSGKRTVTEEEITEGADGSSNRRLLNQSSTTPSLPSSTSQQDRGSHRIPIHSVGSSAEPSLPPSRSNSERRSAWADPTLHRR